MRYLLFIFLLITFLMAQDKGTVSIITTDGSDITGEIVSETENDYTVETPAGLIVTVPKNIVYKVEKFEGLVKEGKLIRLDPNSSTYLFAPSAFPIESSNKYCRDFCVLFPSINYGINDMLSVQGGFIWIPTVKIKYTPLVGSLKATVMQKEKFSLASGLMYLKIPDFTEEDYDINTSLGFGFLFATGTFGDHLNHGSVTLGWGYGHSNGELRMMDSPIVILSGNVRLSNSIAIITENWFIPGLEFSSSPLTLACRFFGKNIAVDAGAIFIIDLIKDWGFPIPIVNFTYNF